MPRSSTRRVSSGSEKYIPGYDEVEVSSGRDSSMQLQMRVRMDSDEKQGHAVDVVMHRSPNDFRRCQEGSQVMIDE